TDGVFVAVGDVTGDKIQDIIITPDRGGGPRVIILAGGDFHLAANFFGIQDPAFRGGARAAAGDINGDGFADLAVAAGFEGGPRPRAGVLADFFAGTDSNRGGVHIVAKNIDGDAFADLITGAGPGDGTRVTAYKGTTLPTDSPQAIYSFDGFPGFNTGVFVG